MTDTENEVGSGSNSTTTYVMLKLPTGLTASTNETTATTGSTSNVIEAHVPAMIRESISTDSYSAFKGCFASFATNDSDSSLFSEFKFHILQTTLHCNNTLKAAFVSFTLKYTLSSTPSEPIAITFTTSDANDVNNTNNTNDTNAANKKAMSNMLSSITTMGTLACPIYKCSDANGHEQITNSSGSIVIMKPTSENPTLTIHITDDGTTAADSTTTYFVSNASINC